MTEAWRLLERESLRAHRWDSTGSCHGLWDDCTNICCKEARAYLAQPMTTLAEKELRHFHELTGMDGLEFEKTLDEATGLRDWTGIPDGAMFRALLAREGELVAALEWALWAVGQESLLLSAPGTITRVMYYHAARAALAQGKKA